MSYGRKLTPTVNDGRFPSSKRIKRLQRNAIISLQSPCDVPVTSTNGILATLTAYLQRAFSSINVDEPGMLIICNAMTKEFPSAVGVTEQDTTTSHEAHNAVCRDGKRKSLGFEGLKTRVLRDNYASTQELAFYNPMLQSNSISSQQLMETTVSVPKTPNASTLMDSRVIAHLNTDYKIFARLLASCLRP